MIENVTINISQIYYCCLHFSLCNKDYSFLITKKREYKWISVIEKFVTHPRKSYLYTVTLNTGYKLTRESRCKPFIIRCPNISNWQKFSSSRWRQCQSHSRLRQRCYCCTIIYSMMKSIYCRCKRLYYANQQGSIVVRKRANATDGVGALFQACSVSLCKCERCFLHFAVKISSFWKRPLQFMLFWGKFWHVASVLFNLHTLSVLRFFQLSI